jgi:EpsI family protein
VKQNVHPGLRFALALLLLIPAAVFLQAHSRPEVLPPRQDLAAFPMQVGGWVGRDTSLPPNVLEILGPGEFLTRLYRRQGDEAYADLFVAYFPSQRTGNTIHSPQNCLPGAGWTPVERSWLPLTAPDGSSGMVNRYLLAKGADRVLVLYWYQAHGRVVASEYWAKFYLVWDAIRRNRTDGSLVRIVTPLALGERPQESERRAVGFAQQVLPMLGPYIPD